MISSINAYSLPNIYEMSNYEIELLNDAKLLTT